MKSYSTLKIRGKQKLNIECTKIHANVRLTVTDRRHGQKVIGCYHDITPKLVELVISLSVESEELHAKR